jgi:hypothetical protein
VDVIGGLCNVSFHRPHWHSVTEPNSFMGGIRFKFRARNGFRNILQPPPPDKSRDQSCIFKMG